MKCRKFFLYFVSCLLFVSVFTSFTSSPNISAVSDSVHVVNSSNAWTSTYSSPFCLDNCSSYNYLIIDFPFFVSPYNTNFELGFLPVDSSNSVYFRAPTASSVIELSGSFSRIWYSVANGSGYLPEGWSVTITLSENNPYASGGITPSGSISLTENGTFDVTSYAEAVVDVPAVVEQGDYHDDLVSINNSIVIGCAVPLVIYFFYAIYKMLLGGSKG